MDISPKGDPPERPPRPVIPPPSPSPPEDGKPALTGEGKSGDSNEATPPQNVTGGMLHVELTQVNQGKSTKKYYYQWCNASYWSECEAWYRKKDGFTVTAVDVSTIDKAACLEKFNTKAQLTKDYTPSWAKKASQENIALHLKDTKLRPPSELRFGLDFRPKNFSTLDMARKGRDKCLQDQEKASRDGRDSKIKAKRRDP